MSGAMEKKECRCPVTVHRHGTLACYRRCGCRCPGCTAANTKAVKAWRAGMVIGDVVGREHVDAAPYRAVLHRLRAAGYGTRQIVSAGGFTSSDSILGVIRPVEDGGRATIKAVTAARVRRAERVLGSCEPDGRTRVDAAGTRRRLQGLAVMGWSLQAVSAGVGLSHRTLESIRIGRVRQVRTSTAQAVSAATRHLMLMPAPTGPDGAQVRTRAVAAGWVAVAAWDAIDDPEACPEDIRPARTRRKAAA